MFIDKFIGDKEFRGRLSEDFYLKTESFIKELEEDHTHRIGRIVMFPIKDVTIVNLYIINKFKSIFRRTNDTRDPLEMKILNRIYIHYYNDRITNEERETYINDIRSDSADDLNITILCTEIDNLRERVRDFNQKCINLTSKVQ